MSQQQSQQPDDVQRFPFGGVSSRSGDEHVIRFFEDEVFSRFLGQGEAPALVRKNKHNQYGLDDVAENDICRICYEVPEKMMFKCKLCKKNVHCANCHVEMAFYYNRLKCSNCNQ